MSDKLDRLKGGEADSKGFEKMPADYMNDLRSIMLSLEARRAFLSDSKTYLALRLANRQMRPLKQRREAPQLISEGYRHCISLLPFGDSFKAVDESDGTVLFEPDLFSETIEY